MPPGQSFQSCCHQVVNILTRVTRLGGWQKQTSVEAENYQLPKVGQPIESEDGERRKMDRALVINEFYAKPCNRIKSYMQWISFVIQFCLQSSQKKLSLFFEPHFTFGLFLRVTEVIHMFLIVQNTHLCVIHPVFLVLFGFTDYLYYFFNPNFGQKGRF